MVIRVPESARWYYEYCGDVDWIPHRHVVYQHIDDNDGFVLQEGRLAIMAKFITENDVVNAGMVITAMGLCVFPMPDHRLWVVCPYMKRECCDSLGFYKE